MSCPVDILSSQRLLVKDANLSLLELYQWLYARRGAGVLLVYKGRSLLPDSTVRMRDLAATTEPLYLGLLDLRVYPLVKVPPQIGGSLYSTSAKETSRALCAHFVAALDRDDLQAARFYGIWVPKLWPVLADLLGLKIGRAPPASVADLIGRAPPASVADLLPGRGPLA